MAEGDTPERIAWDEANPELLNAVLHAVQQLLGEVKGSRADLAAARRAMRRELDAERSTRRRQFAVIAVALLAGLPGYFGAWVAVTQTCEDVNTNRATLAGLATGLLAFGQDREAELPPDERAQRQAYRAQAQVFIAERTVPLDCGVTGRVRRAF